MHFLTLLYIIVETVNDRDVMTTTIDFKFCCDCDDTYSDALSDCQVRTYNYKSKQPIET